VFIRIIVDLFYRDFRYHFLLINYFIKRIDLYPMDSVFIQIIMDLFYRDFRSHFLHPNYFKSPFDINILSKLFDTSHYSMFLVAVRPKLKRLSLFVFTIFFPKFSSEGYFRLIIIWQCSSPPSLPLTAISFTFRI
jgi:hypothetical protein